MLIDIGGKRVGACGQEDSRRIRTVGGQTAEVLVTGSQPGSVGRRSRGALGNDFSERTCQRNERTYWRGKNTDTFKPIGPWIVTGLDPDDLEVTVRVNGRHMITSSANTDGVLYNIQTFIARMTKYLTLVPGDVIWMGTDCGPANVVDGDVIEVEVPEMGVLPNPVVREK